MQRGIAFVCSDLPLSRLRFVTHHFETCPVGIWPVRDPGSVWYCYQYATKSVQRLHFTRAR